MSKQEGTYKVPKKLLKALNGKVKRVLKAWFFDLDGVESFWEPIEHHIEYILPDIRGYKPRVWMLIKHDEYDNVYINLDIFCGRTAYIAKYLVGKRTLKLKSIEKVKVVRGIPIGKW